MTLERKRRHTRRVPPMSVLGLALLTGCGPLTDLALDCIDDDVAVRFLIGNFHDCGSVGRESELAQRHKQLVDRWYFFLVDQYDLVAFRVVDDDRYVGGSVGVV